MMLFSDSSRNGRSATSFWPAGVQCAPKRSEEAVDLARFGNWLPMQHERAIRRGRKVRLLIAVVAKLDIPASRGYYVVNGWSAPSSQMSLNWVSAPNPAPRHSHRQASARCWLPAISASRRREARSRSRPTSPASGTTPSRSTAAPGGPVHATGFNHEHALGCTTAPNSQRTWAPELGYELW